MRGMGSEAWLAEDSGLADGLAFTEVRKYSWPGADSRPRSAPMGLSLGTGLGGSVIPPPPSTALSCSSIPPPPVTALPTCSAIPPPPVTALPSCSIVPPLPVTALGSSSAVPPPPKTALDCSSIPPPPSIAAP